MTERRAQLAIGLLAALCLATRAYPGADRLFEPFFVFDDDAYYYLQIARHLVAGNGFTFDGVHRTNGFQPLWQFVLVPLAAVWRDPRALAQAVIVLQVVLGAAGAVLLFRNLRPGLSRISAAAAALLLVAQPGAAKVLVTGMESALFVCMLGAAWWAFHRWWASPAATSRALLAGLALAAAFLTRIEAAMFTAVALVLAVRRRPRPAAFAALGLPTAVSALVLAVWWKVSFGVWAPISGIVKAEWARQGGFLDNTTMRLDLPWFGHWLIERLTGWQRNDGRMAIAHGLLLAGLLALALRHRHWLRARLAPVTGTLPVLGGVLMVVSMKVVLPEFSSWHAAPFVFTVAVLAGVVWPAGRRGILVLAGMVALMLWRDVRRVAEHARPATTCSSAAVDAIRFLDNAGGQPVGSRNAGVVGSWNAGVVGSWNAGLFGYLSGGRVVNLDGLVNDADFLATVVRSNDVLPYLDRNGIFWVVDYFRGRYVSRFEEAFQRIAVFPVDDRVACGVRVSVWRRRTSGNPP